MQIKALTTNIMVNDVETSLAFYRDLLGLTVQMHVNHEGKIGWAMLSNGSAGVMLESVAAMQEDLHHEAVKPIAGSFVFYCEVDDVDAAYQKLAGKAPILFEMRQTEYGAREFGVLDPDGYSVTLATNQGV